MGEVVSIWIKRAHRGPMDRVNEAELVAGRGVSGSADQGGKRQITMIAEESWDDALEVLGIGVDPSERRANVLLRGVDLRDSRGKLLRVGSAVVRVYGETRPCHLMDEARQGLRDALRPNWRGGVFGEIIEGGTVRVRDAASLLP
jgi:MOSC domain-containing protein YiiM